MLNLDFLRDQSMTDTTFIFNNQISELNLFFKMFKMFLFA